MLETSIVTRAPGQFGAEPLSPEIKALETGDTYGKFAIEPLERGFGITVGNPMRRILLSSVEGTAITWIKVDGVLHEYSSIPHMKEEVIEFLLNVKGIRIRSVTERPGKMRLEITGEGRVCAGDIATSADFEIVNPELHLATLDSDDATLSVEFNVDHGKGYQPITPGDGLSSPLMGVLPLDAVFNPVKKVNYSVERTRVGHVTDYERLLMEIWTDGTITPVEALKKSSEVLVTHFFLFGNLGSEARPGSDRPSIMVSPDVYQTPIEKLELSPRTLNCLKRAHISKVGQVLEMSNNELLKIRNFGEKSLQEMLSKLSSQGMLNEQEYAARMASYETLQDSQNGGTESASAEEEDDHSPGDMVAISQIHEDDDEEEEEEDDEEEVVAGIPGNDEGLASRRPPRRAPRPRPYEEPDDEDEA